MNGPYTAADLDMGDALLAAIRLQTAGDFVGAALAAIGLDPVAACDRLWTPPSRASGHVDGSGVRR